MSTHFSAITVKYFAWLWFILWSVLAWYFFAAPLLWLLALPPWFLLLRQRAPVSSGENEVLYRNLFRRNKAVALIIDPKDNTIIDANQAAANFYGYRVETLRRMNFSQLNTLSASALYAEMQQAKSAQRHQFFFKQRLASNELRDVEVLAGPIEAQGRTLLYALVHDITQRKRAEQALRESEDRFRRIFEHGPLGMIIVNLHRHIVHANSAFAQMLGYSPDDLINISLEQLTHPQDLAENQRLIDNALQGEASAYCVENRYLTRTGGIVWGRLSMSIFFDAHDKPEYLLGMIDDISRHKHAEAALRESQQRYASIVHTIEGVVWEADARDFRFSFVSKQAERLLGYPQQAWLEEADFWLNRIYPDDRAQALAHRRASIANNSGHDTEYRLLRIDGSAVWVRELVSVEKSQPQQLRGIIFDITRQKAAETALRESEEKFRQLAENIGQVLWLRHQNEILYVNPAYENVFGLPRAGLYRNPRQFSDAVIAEDRAWVETGLQQACVNKQNFSAEFRIRRGDGEIRWIWLRTFRFNTADGSDRVVGIAEDISPLKEAEAKLTAAKEIAEAANHAKDEFLTNVSHEIRTPLNAILGFSDLIRAQVKDPAQTAYAASIHTAGKELLGLFNNIIDLSKIESGQLEIQHQPVDLCALLRETGEIFKHNLAADNIQFRLECSAAMPGLLELDGARFTQILHCLLDNARKFTQQGEIRVHAQAVHNGAGQVQISVAVSDSGIGIAAEAHERIFASFQQADGQSTRKYSGAGLGLTIAKRLSERMGGTISVRSRLGQGSTFTLHLPAALISAPLPTLTIQAVPDAIKVPQSWCQNLDDNRCQLLRHRLEQEFLPRARALEVVVEMEQVSDFAHALAELAQQFQAPILDAHAQVLEHAAEQFDIVTIEENMRAFPDFIRTFVTKSSKNNAD
jgi:PAS domain S-box-containing protein